MSSTEQSFLAKRWRRGLKGTLLVFSLVLSAYVMAVAIASPSHPWLAWIALPPLLLAIRHLVPETAMVCGAVWGCSLYLFGVSGVQTPIEPTLGALALLTITPAAYAFLGALLTRGIGYSALFLAIGWIGVEVALSPLALENGLLAGTQGNGPFVHVLGGLFGYGLVAFLIAFANGLLLSLLSDIRFSFAWQRQLDAPQELRQSLLLLTSPYFPHFSVTLAQPRAPPI